MPMIDLMYVRGSLDDHALGRLTDELVTALLRAERAPDTPFLRDNTLVYLHDVGSGGAVGGRTWLGRAPIPRRDDGVRRRIVAGPQGTARG